MRFTHIDVNFDVKYEGHQNCWKNTFYAHFEGFWSPSYVRSKLTSICVNLIMWIYYFFVNLLHSPGVWLLTSFWQLDIFLTTWHLFWHMGNGTNGQRSIMVNTEDRDGVPWGWGTWVMGHMGNWANDHNFLNTAWIFTKILLDIDIDVFYLNILWFFHDSLK